MQYSYTLIIVGPEFHEDHEDRLQHYLGMGSKKEIKEDPTISQGTLLVAHTAQTWEGKNQSAQQGVVIVAEDYRPVGFAEKDFGLKNMFFYFGV